MGNTLQYGDIVFINKISGINRHDVVAFYEGTHMDSLVLKIKRCIALPGDTVLIKHSNLFINKRAEIIDSSNFLYFFRFFSRNSLREYSDLYLNWTDTLTNYTFAGLSLQKISELHSDTLISLNRKITFTADIQQKKVIGGNNLFQWNADNFGPYKVPYSGMKIALNPYTISLYKDLILGENTEILLKNNKLYLDNKIISYYTFVKNYYFLLNDTRFDSHDSRENGVVSESFIQGEASWIWFSVNENYSIRWQRIFKLIN